MKTILNLKSSGQTKLKEENKYKTTTIWHTKLKLKRNIYTSFELLKSAWKNFHSRKDVIKNEIYYVWVLTYDKGIKILLLYQYF